MTKKSILPILLSSLLFWSVASADLAELLPEEMKNAAGETVTRDSLKGKLIGIYFSAQWCPPCRAFTPRLVEFRNQNEEDFEVIFVSSDRSPEDQMKYMKDYKMNFLTLEHRSEAANKLAQHFEVRGIPHLAIINDQGEIVRANARGEVASGQDDLIEAWRSEGS